MVPTDGENISPPQAEFSAIANLVRILAENKHGVSKDEFSQLLKKSTGYDFVHTASVDLSTDSLYWSHWLRNSDLAASGLESLGHNCLRDSVGQGRIIKGSAADFAKNPDYWMLDSILDDPAACKHVEIVPYTSSDFKAVIMFGALSQARSDESATLSKQILVTILGEKLVRDYWRARHETASAEITAILGFIEEHVHLLDSTFNVVSNGHTEDKCYDHFDRKSPCTGCPLTQGELDRHTQFSVRSNSAQARISLSPIHVSGQGRRYIEVIRHEETQASKDESSRDLRDDMQRLFDISHDMNQPLTGIAGYCTLLKGELGDDPSKQADVVTIEREARRLTQLVFDFQRIAKGLGITRKLKR